jgi:nucleoprotein TPR
MKTRRKSRVTAQFEADADGSQAADENVLNMHMPEDLDIESLQNILPDISIMAPSSDAIVLLYRFVLAQAEEVDVTQMELEEARAHAEKKEIELDQALQDRESQTKDLEAYLDTVQSELKAVKQERDQLGVFHPVLFPYRALLMLYSVFTS